MANKRSGDLVRQCASIMLMALQTGDLSREALIDRVAAVVGDNAYGESPTDAFERDKVFLKSLGFEITYQRKSNVYHLEPHNPLLALPLSHAEGQLLALIRRAFRDTPYACPRHAVHIAHPP